MIDLEMLRDKNDMIYDLIGDITNDFKQCNDFDADDVFVGLAYSIVEKAKTLIILEENNQSMGQKTMLRLIFESTKVLKFLLKEDTENRTKAFILSKRIKIAELYGILDNKEVKQYVRKLGKSMPTDINLKNLEEDKKTYYELTGKKYSGDWMAVGIKGENTNFRKLCKSIGDDDLAEYDLNYTYLSEEVHGKDIELYFPNSSWNIEDENLKTRVFTCLIEVENLLVEKYKKQLFICKKMSMFKKKHSNEI